MPRKVRDSFPNPFRAAAGLAPPHLPGWGEGSTSPASCWTVVPLLTWSEARWYTGAHAAQPQSL